MTIFSTLAGVDTDDVAAANTFLGSDSYEVQGIARPKNEEEVKTVVDWANKHKVALVPLSSPAGTRRRSPADVRGPFAVLDMSRMSRVIHADSQDAIALIEPGVTFPEFDAQLKKQGLRSMKPFMPRRSKSVIACFLDREPTTIPNEHWDTTDPLACLSLVMGSGEVFRTGGASLYENLQEALDNGLRQMTAAGPVVTDYGRVMLGSQGTLGITCWASIYCERIPTIEQGHLYGAEDANELVSMLRHLALHQIGAQYFILSRAQLAAALAENSEHFTELNKTLPAWSLYVNITAADYQPEKSLEWQRKDIERFVETTSIKAFSSEHSALLSALEARLHDSPEQFYKDTAKGTHTDVFCLTQMSNVRNLVAAAQKVLSSTDLEAGMYLQPTIQGTTCHVEANIFHSGAEKDAASQLEKQLFTALADSGGFFSRPYGDWSAEVFKRNDSVVPHLKRVKKIFDPSGVLSPGKLCY